MKIYGRQTKAFQLILIFLFSLILIPAINSIQNSNLGVDNIILQFTDNNEFTINAVYFGGVNSPRIISGNSRAVEPGRTQYSEIIVEINGPTTDSIEFWTNFNENYVNRVPNPLDAMIYFLDPCQEGYSSCNAQFAISLIDVKVSSIKTFVDNSLSNAIGIELITLTYDSRIVMEDVDYSPAYTTTSNNIGSSITRELFTMASIEISYDGIIETIYADNFQYGIRYEESSSAHTQSISGTYIIEDLILSFNDMENSIYFWNIFDTQAVVGTSFQYCNINIYFHKQDGTSIQSLTFTSAEAFINSIVSSTELSEGSYLTTMLVSFTLRDLDYMGGDF